ncbi:hypothetical protein M514_05364 [Trichuris suis]|uniref:Uncharacterized protein n=1 Tax=Trichuris suis TaxID=68888 RepID=A0A085NQA6_9BILA|nr:hypothetical protein M513_05364 [Trichuris suis]KFD71652.1 hypothetical protein M514_05364 [Trichuris suis]
MELAVSSSGVVEHVLTCRCPDDQITVTRMHQEPFFRLVKLKEALYIRQNPCINRDEGVEVSATWSAVAVGADRATTH